MATSSKKKHQQKMWGVMNKETGDWVVICHTKSQAYDVLDEARIACNYWQLMAIWRVKSIVLIH